MVIQLITKRKAFDESLFLKNKACDGEKLSPATRLSGRLDQSLSFHIVAFTYTKRGGRRKM